jgi:3-oxoadipate enol-lactonase
LQHEEVIASAKAMIDSANPQGYASCCLALRDFDAREIVSSITLPTLVIAGSHDLATPPADGRFLADKIPGARYVELHAAHLSNIEAEARFTPEVENFLNA